MALPEEFVGTFKLEKSENFDEYLAAKGSHSLPPSVLSKRTGAGVPWLIRKVILMSSLTRKLEATEGGGFRHHVFGGSHSSLSHTRIPALPVFRVAL